MPLRTQPRSIGLPRLSVVTQSYPIAMLLLFLIVTAGCRLPDLPTNNAGGSLAVEAESAVGSEERVSTVDESEATVEEATVEEAVVEEADKQAGVSAAATAVEDTSTEVSEVADASVAEAPAEAPAAEAPAAEAPANVDWLTVTNRADYELPAIGNPDAALTITEFSDFMWPGCRAHVLGVETELKAAYVQSGQVRFIFNPVLNHGDRSIQSHMASECAGDQGQFWPFRTYLFEHQNRLWRGDIRQTVKELATEFGLEVGDFNACIDEQRHLARLTTQDNVRKEKGIQGQPMFDVGGEIYGGSAPFDAWATLIDPLVGN